MLMNARELVRQAPLRQRMLVLMVTLLAMLVVLSGGLAYTMAQRNAAMQETTEVLEPARSSLTRLRQGLIDQATGLRGYIVSRDDALLETRRAGAAATDRALARLARLLADDELATQVRAISDAVRRWEQEVAEPQLALAEEGRWEEATALAASNVSDQELASARAAIEELRGPLVARQGEQSAAASAADRWLTALVVLTLAGGFAHVAASGWVLRRWVTTPLERVRQAAIAVTEGARHERVPVTGPPDVARLAEAVELMRSTIVGLLDDAVRARQALEQQGQAVLLFRQELAASQLPLPAGLAAAAHLRPAEGLLAGDWYDILPSEDGTATAVVVDVSGHGTRAGVLALRAKHLLETAIRRGLPPDEALGWLAGSVGETEEDFLTAILVRVDPTTGVCQYANAGHRPGIVVRPGGRSRRLEPTGPLLGPFSASWSTETVTLDADAVLLLYTDGLVEARDHHGEEFGVDRLIGIAEDAVDHGPAGVLAACMEAATAFAAGGLADDVTVVALAADADAPHPPQPPNQLRQPWADVVGM